MTTLPVPQLPGQTYCYDNAADIREGLGKHGVGIIKVRRMEFDLFVCTHPDLDDQRVFGEHRVRDILTKWAFDTLVWASDVEEALV